MQHVRWETRKGFTIVELLIVIVVIAILAAIVIVSYNGIRIRAVESALMSNLSQARDKITEFQVVQSGTNTYPPNLAAAGLVAPSNTTYDYVGSDTYYCLSATQAGVTFRVKSNDLTPIRGRCSVTGVVTTLAGSTAGFANNNGTAAQFDSPRGIATGPDGVMYVADRGNNRVRTVTTQGVVGTLAGSGISGTADGAAASAQFTYLTGITVGSDGAVYVTDNNAVRKIAGGMVSTLAGSVNSSGNTNATGAAARFLYPAGLAFCPDGALYVADTSNALIRRINVSTGQVTTYAGSSSGFLDSSNPLTARFADPYGLACTSEGTLYVGETNTNRRIRQITNAGVVSTYAGSGSIGSTDANGTSATFSTPAGVALYPDGTLYIMDQGNSLLRKIATNRDVSFLAGSFGGGYADGTGSAARFGQPWAITTGSDGALYVSDAANNRIRKVE